MLFRQNYPSAHGGRSFSFSYGINSRRPQWLIVGQEGGTLVRTQATRILNATNESSVSIYVYLFIFNSNFIFLLICSFIF